MVVTTMKALVIVLTMMIAAVMMIAMFGGDR